MKLLVFAPATPPSHGQDGGVQEMLAAFGGNRRRQPLSAPDSLGIECYHVNAPYAGATNSQNAETWKFCQTLACCLQAIWCRWRYGVRNFYYVPAFGSRAALCRDWLVVFLCRPFFQRVIFHWADAGAARWLETEVLIRARSITYRLMKAADLSIAPSEQNRRDAEKLLPRRAVALSGGNRSRFAAELAAHLRSLEAPPTSARAGAASLKLALTILAENPQRKTGLTTMFHELVSRSLRLFPDVAWVIFAGPNQEWTIQDPRVEVVRDFPANDRLNRRLFADHFRVPAAARKHGAQALLTVGFVPTRKSLPTVLHVLSLQTLDKRNRLGFFREFYRNSMIKYNWPHADLIITNSQWTAGQVSALDSEFNRRLVISYEGLQHEIFHPVANAGEAGLLREKFGIQPGYFLWISNFYPYKQAPLLLAGYARLGADVRRRHPLVMAGGNWLDGLDQARAVAERLGIEQDVRFFGWVDDGLLAPLYRQARAFCLASREETFGRCVIEAMACGTPCVVNDIPVLREVTGGHALIVDYHDAGGVAAALQRLVADEPLAGTLRDAGIARARDFTFEKLATERVAAIRRLVDEARTGAN
jgi:glycosyltransferase involved in cell wall biosynthesis